MIPGLLTLIPTPLDEQLPLEPVALELLKEQCLKPQTLLLIEEHKVARVRWLQWGLAREAIERFVVFNEHSQEKLLPEIIKELKNGKQAYLMSDGGLPAFCDPGQALVNACHEAKIKVTSTPFPNSIALALALSGFPHHEFHFSGFLPANADERKRALEKISKSQLGTLILMDTPYRLQALLKDLAASPLKNRRYFLAIDLNHVTERLYQGTLSEIQKWIGDLNKVEFVMIIKA